MVSFPLNEVDFLPTAINVSATKTICKDAVLPAACDLIERMWCDIPVLAGDGQSRPPVGASQIAHQAMTMASRKPEIQMRSFGIYTKWDSNSKDLPRLLEVTTRVPATVDIEFGFVVHIQGGKNRELDYSIDHPGILDADGARRAPFVGTVYVKSNDWNFYLGDTIWEPVKDKLGNWHLSLQMDGKTVAEKTFEVFHESKQDWHS